MVRDGLKERTQGISPGDWNESEASGTARGQRETGYNSFKEILQLPSHFYLLAL